MHEEAAHDLIVAYRLPQTLRRLAALHACQLSVQGDWLILKYSVTLLAPSLGSTSESAESLLELPQDTWFHQPHPHQDGRWLHDCDAVLPLVQLCVGEGRCSHQRNLRSSPFQHPRLGGYASHRCWGTSARFLKSLATEPGSKLPQHTTRYLAVQPPLPLWSGFLLVTSLAGICWS